MVDGRRNRSAHLRALCVCFVSSCFIFICHVARAHKAITTNLTWSEDVRPVLQKKCMSCHHPGGMAPEYVDLTTYGGKPGHSGAFDWAKAIEEEIMMHRMPPWRADGRFGEFANQRGLTKEETNIVIGWIQGGTPQGPRRDLPPPDEFVRKRDWELGPPSMEIAAPEEYTVPKGTRDGFYSWKFKIPDTFGKDATGKERKEQWITGYEFFPGNPVVAHTMTALIHDPEGLKEEAIKVEVQKPYDPLADTERKIEETRLRKMPIGTHFLGQWVRGDAPTLYPDEAGRKLRGGSVIEIQIIYRKQGVEDVGVEYKDKSRLGLYFAPQPTDLLIESKKISNGDFAITAGEKNQEIKTDLTLDENVHLIGVHPHMGFLGKDLEIRADYPDGKTQTLLWIPEYKNKWESSFLFKAPIAAPTNTRLHLVGHYDNTKENKDNPNRPPADVKSGDGPAQERLTAWLDYYLDDHLIVATPTPTPRPQVADQGGMLGTGLATGGVLFDLPKDPNAPPAEKQVAAVQPKPAESQPPNTDQNAAQPPSAGKDEIYWCPMRGPRPGDCPLKDYHAPGKCEVCGMELKPKKSFFEKIESGTVASKRGKWDLTKEGSAKVYWCPNRGRADHELKAYSEPGKCEVCGETLIHMSQFKPFKTYMCLTPGCPSEYKMDQQEIVFYSPGLCPDCGQPVQPMGHMDHNPLHGGQFFMAENLYHHLEGTLPAPDQFRLYFYDDWKKPLDPRNFSGKVVFSQYNKNTGETATQEYPLAYARQEDEFLTAKIPPQEKFPAEFKAVVSLAGEQKGYDFVFDELTREPLPGELPASVRPHIHVVRPPVQVPEKAADAVKEIFKRDKMLMDRIAAKQWYDLHIPAFDAMDLAEAMKLKQEGLNPRSRGKLMEAISKITQGAVLLDRYGDAADAARVNKGYETFAEGVKALKELYLDAAK